MSNIIEDLQDRLVGKIISAIEPSNGLEALCKFVMSDGSSFRLHATDLGAWIEEDIKSDGFYPDINSLAQAVHNYRYRLSTTIPSVSAEIVSDVIMIDVCNGELFRIKRSSKDEWENKILKHPDVCKFLPRALEFGDMWKTFFYPNNMECFEGELPVPEELILSK